MADDRSKAPRPKIVTEQTQGEAPQQATPHLQAASAPRDTSSDPVSRPPRHHPNSATATRKAPQCRAATSQSRGPSRPTST